MTAAPNHFLVGRPGVGKTTLLLKILRMELYSGHFRMAVLSALDCDKPVLATVMAHSDPFVDGLKARPDVRVVEVTQENRERLAEELAAQLMSEIR